VIGGRTVECLHPRPFRRKGIIQQTTTAVRGVGGLVWIDECLCSPPPAPPERFCLCAGCGSGKSPPDSGPRLLSKDNSAGRDAFKTRLTQVSVACTATLASKLDSNSKGECAAISQVAVLENERSGCGTGLRAARSVACFSGPLAGFFLKKKIWVAITGTGVPGSEYCNSATRGHDRRAIVSNVLVVWSGARVADNPLVTMVLPRVRPAWSFVSLLWR
jgi:hypothetical protein